MIHSLQESSFSRFGRIEAQMGPEGGPIQSIKLLQTESVDLFSFPVDTVWDYDSGMTVLLILDGKEEILFYLDRAVTIYGGITFGFYPMGEECSFRCQMPVGTDTKPTASLSRPKGGENVKPMQILTRFLQYGRDGFYFRGERHGPNEICYVKKGVLHNYCEGEKITLRQGEVLIFDSNRWHMQYAEEEVRFLTVSFRWEGKDFSSWSGQAITVTPEMERSLLALGQTREGEEAEEFYQAHLKLLLLYIMEQPSRENPRKKALPASEIAHRQIINKAMQTVSGRVYNPPGVAELSKAVNVSPSQLSALFQNYLGTSPAKYITRIRLEESKILLLAQGLSIGEVARRLNYSSVQHFSRQFHDYFGMTPSSFAKTNSQ